MTALPQDAVADLQQRIAELERQLETAVEERDAAIERQTASALVNFRLKNELRAVTDRQKASAEILNAIANTQGDAEHALQRIAETTANFFNAAGVTVRIAEGDAWVQTVRVGPASHATGAQPAAEIATGGHNMPGTVYGENRQIHIPDLDNIDPSMANWPATAARAAGIRTICGTPLRRGAKAIGALIVYRDRLAPFTEDELALQQSFADQAVIAIENARLFNETKEALERQTATAEILRVIASSPSDVQPVFEAIVNSAADLFSPHSITITTLKDDKLHWRATAARGPSLDLEKATAVFPVPFDPERAPSARAILERRIIEIPDAASPDTPELARKVALAGGFRSITNVPLVHQDRGIGTIILTHPEPGFRLTPSQLELVQTFADQAVIAIENTRLFNETQEALERQTATADILKVIASSPSDVQPVFDAIATSSKRLLGGFGTAVYRIIDGMVCLQAFTPTTPEQDEVLKASFPAPAADGAFVARLQRGETVQVVDAEIDEDERVRRIAIARGWRSAIFTPLMNAGVAIGFISITRLETGAFADHHVQLLQTFADQAVIAIENTRLFNETQEALERQTATADILKVIASSPSDVQPVFEAIVNSAAQLFEPCAATITTLKDDKLHWNAAAGSIPGFDVENTRTVYPLPFDRERAPSARAIFERRIIEFPDVESMDTPEFTRKAAAAGRFRSITFVPLVDQEQGIGTIIFTHPQAGHRFSERQLALMQTFADQAVIAIQNTRLFNETREALERQTATADILKVIASSPSDLQPVFEAIVGSAARLFEPWAATIVTVKDEELHWNATAALHPEFDVEGARAIYPVPFQPDHFPSARAIAERRILEIPDIETSDTFAIARQSGRMSGFRSVTLVPLIDGARGIGVINLTHHQAGSKLSDKQLALVQTFADQAVIAIQNTRLFNETQEALERQTATADILKVIASSPSDTTPVFEAIAGSAKRLLGALSAAVFRIIDGTVHIAAFTPINPTADTALKADFPRPVEGFEGFQFAQHGQPFAIPDTEERKTGTLREVARLHAFRSMLYVPLMNGEVPFGIITVTRAEPGGFRPHHIQLLQTFADQAVIAIENTRLFNEVQERTVELTEALEQQTATAEVLGVISSSPGDLAPVFDAMLGKAMQLCSASFGVLNTYDGKAFTTAATYGLPPAYDEYRRKQPQEYGPATAPARLLEGEPFVQFTDLLKSEAYRNGEPNRRALVDIGGARCLLAVPLVKDGHVVGLVMIFRQENRPFSEKQIALLQQFAAQAVIAIENTRLLRELRESTEDLTESLQQQTATSEVLQIISSSPGDLVPVFDKMLENATRVCGAEFGSMLLVEDDGLRQAALYNAPAALAAVRANRVMQYDPQSVPAIAISTRQVVQIEDIRTSPAYLKRAQATVQIAELGGARTIVVVPMLRDAEAIGSITVYRQEVRPFSEKQVELLTNFARQAVIAIENARLLRELRQRTDDLSESLEQQTAISDILGVISSSPGDIKPVFQTVARHAAEICEAQVVDVLTVEDDKLVYVAHFGDFERLVQGENAPLNRDTVMGRSVVDKRPVHIADLQGTDHDFALGREYALRFGHRTTMAVPLIRDDHALGTILIRRADVRPFEEKHIALLKMFADQAVIAIENARLLRELRQRTDDLSESLQFQTATSDVLKVISRSPDALQPVLDAIAETSRELCDSDTATIFILIDGKFHLTAVSGETILPAHLHHMRSNPVAIGQPGSVLTRVVRERRSLHIPNVMDDPELREGTAGVGGPRALLAAPLMREGEADGVIILRQSHLKPFTPRQIQAIETFADQAVIAISNVNLFEQVQAKTRDLTESLQFQTATSDVLKVISRSPDALQPVLDVIVETSRTLCGSDASTIFLLRDSRFHVAAISGSLPAHLEYMKANPHSITESGSALPRVYHQKRTLHYPNVMDDPELAAGATGRGGARALLNVPLMSEGQVIGVITLRNSYLRPFTPRQIQAVETFADQAVIAISNVNLFDEVQQRTRELSKSLDDLRTAQDRLIQTEKLASLGQLTAGIAHEIKNPLNFVNNFSALSVELTDELNDILKKAELAEQLRNEIDELTGMLKDNLSRVVQHGKRADSIVKNMLLHSREGSGEHRPADVNALVDESLNLAYHGARAEKPQFNVTLKRDFDPQAGQVEVFPQEITRVLLNLISNGFYAVTKRKADNGAAEFEPLVTATTRGSNDHVEIRIRDNGTGIPPEVKEKMFNPFFTTKPAGEGTGLGLSMSHDIIVKQHGGTIEVDTEPGAFTEFRLVLPRTSVAKPNGNR